MGLSQCLATPLCPFGQLDLPFFVTFFEIFIFFLYSQQMTLPTSQRSEGIRGENLQTFHYQTLKPASTCTNFLLSLSFYIRTDVPALWLPMR